MSLLSKIKEQELGAYTVEEIAEVAEYLKDLDVGLAYYKYWQGHLSDTNLPNPAKDCDWKIPEYASGIGAWLDICKLNGWG
jgi:hypothetical protein